MLPPVAWPSVADLHGMTHFSLTLKPIVPDFNIDPQNAEYLQSLMILVALVLALGFSILVLLALFLCLVISCLQQAASRKTGGWRSEPKTGPGPHDGRGLIALFTPEDSPLHI